MKTKDDTLKREVIPFVHEFNTIPIIILDELLEWCHDKQLLNGNGEMFRHYLWELFIKSKPGE